MLSVSLAPGAATAQMAILNIDPERVSRHERVMWVKIQNRAGNEQITLKVYRLGDTEPSWSTGRLGSSQRRRHGTTSTSA
jgi:hypothetical protein